MMVDEHWAAIPPLQRALLESVMKHGAAHPAIDAGVVVGSLAKGKADRVSDVDLLLLAEPGFHKQGDELVRTIVGDRPIFHCWQGRHEEVCSYWRVIFLDMSSIEIHILDRGAEFPLAKPYLPLFDKTSSLGALEVAGPAPSHWDFPAYYGRRGWAGVGVVRLPQMGGTGPAWLGQASSSQAAGRDG
ncbi:nucleotidyltransferase domain-containing protein [Aeromonas veronii]|uniref:nucleotidyltransferase domain-containing protein n=1 Tax=Aeromonas veronii TaxID=654 RepID=UPI0021D7F66B|nr:nucleotidyltransferase domain-containing protein [Aeromonas veronii]UYB70525.1 nucleotidyltransferase domain-containing protein [Aeromonas veronii]